jgi:flagellar hook-associated protein 1 FlgK
MVTLFGLLNVGYRGINAAQAGLNTTGHNLANVNTEGYTRQRVDQQSTNPLVTTNGAFGQGVEIVSVERLRDMFLEAQIRDVQSNTSFNEELDNIFLRIEAFLSDPLTSVSDSVEQSTAGGINNLLSRFFRAMHDLSLTPEAPEVRTTVVESAESLSQNFNFIAEEMSLLRSDLNDRVALYVQDINRITTELASLNQRISVTELGDRVQANDLKDKRDKLLADLSKIIPISTNEDRDSMINVTFMGQHIVNGVIQQNLLLETSQTEDGITLYSFRINQQGLDVLDDSVRKGKLGAILDARDRIIPFLQNDVDTLARGIINEVNKIHSGASGIEGYSSLRSHFDFPVGVANPDSRRTLDSIFNNPDIRGDTSLGAQPFPVTNGEFSIRVADSDNSTRDVYTVNVDTDDSIYDIIQRIDRSDGIVNTARSALRFDPVFVERAQGTQGVGRDELNASLSQLRIAQGMPIAETPGTYSFEIHLQDAAGNGIDSDPTTREIEPFTVQFTDDMTLSELRTAIQTAGNGKIKANLVPSALDSTITVLQIEPLVQNASLSIQNDNSGLIRAFEFPLTDPNTPLIGGTAVQAMAEFSGSSAASFLGTDNPAFSPAFPGPPPSVVSEGTLELVIVDNNNVPTVTTLTINATNGIQSIDDLAAAIEAADANLDVEITNDNQLIINASNYRSFFFQNDKTGLVDALGFNEINGYGQIASQPFVDGSFEIVVVNDTGTVMNIFEVPVNADPSFNGGVMSLREIVDSINHAAGEVGAPIVASIVKDLQNPNLNQLQIEAVKGYEFTFRSDDSLLLSALGFVNGPVLDESGDNPILGAAFPIGIGDNIGGMVRAEWIPEVGIEISTAGEDKITLVGDSSNFLSSVGINTLFFGTDAQSMSVSRAILDNVNLLATSGDGMVGNNEAVLRMAELETKAVIRGKTLSEQYQSTIASLGIESSRANQFYETNNAILQELKSIQEQNSGVSIDEESINLIRYQQAYQASARVISIIDQLLDIVINRLGS